MQTMKQTYTINYTNGEPRSITCHVCSMTSYNENDISHKYCGMCHEFHDVLALRERDSGVTSWRNVDAQVAKPPLFLLKFGVLSLVGSLIWGFINMATNNTGIVKEFGVWNSLILCVTAALVGCVLGFSLFRWYPHIKFGTNSVWLGFKRKTK